MTCRRGVHRTLRRVEVNTLSFIRGRLTFLSTGSVGVGFQNDGGYRFNERVCACHAASDVLGSLLDSRTALEEFFCGCAARLRRLRMQLIVHYEEHHELVRFSACEDVRFYNSFKIVVRTESGNCFVEEVPLSEGLPETLMEDIRDFTSTVVGSQLSMATLVRRSAAFEQLDEALTVLLEPRAAGAFFHEIIGHMIERDTYELVKARLSHASFDPKIIFRDDVRDYERVCGLNKFDDEGTKIVPITLVADGKLCNTMDTQRFSGEGGLSGFARAESILYPPLPRMRMSLVSSSTHIERPSLPVRYFRMEKFLNGSVMPGSMNFWIQGSGAIVQEGVRVALLPHAVVTGNVIDALERIPYMGDDERAFFADCFKGGQTVRVGYRAPSVVLKPLRISGTAYMLRKDDHE